MEKRQQSSDSGPVAKKKKQIHQTDLEKALERAKKKVTQLEAAVEREGVSKGLTTQSAAAASRGEEAVSKGSTTQSAAATSRGEETRGYEARKKAADRGSVSKKPTSKSVATAKQKVAGAVARRSHHSVEAPSGLLKPVEKAPEPSGALKPVEEEVPLQDYDDAVNFFDEAFEGDDEDARETDSGDSEYKASSEEEEEDDNDEVEGVVCGEDDPELDVECNLPDSLDSKLHFFSVCNYFLRYKLTS